MNKAWQGLAVVVVDDSSGVRQHNSGIFNTIGMKVEGEANNGVEGVDLVSAIKPDLVSLDLIMPEMDGVECYRKISTEFPDVKIIVVSWLSSEPRIIENLKEIIPADRFIPKPLTSENLISRLDLLFPDLNARTLHFKR